MDARITSNCEVVVDFGLHEILHTVFVLQDTFENHVLERPEIQQRPELEQLAMTISVMMGALYQALGGTEGAI